MYEMSKKLDKDLSKVFFNSVEEMNECYGIDAELPIKSYRNADLVCYEIVEPFVCDYLAQYVFTKKEFCHLDNLGEPVIRNLNEITLESEVYEDDLYRHKGRCFLYLVASLYIVISMKMHHIVDLLIVLKLKCQELLLQIKKGCQVT